MIRNLLALVAVLALGSMLGGCYVMATHSGISVSIPTPTLVMIPGTHLRVVQGYDDVLYYGGSYYRYHNGMWWQSRHHHTDWVVTRSVPRALLDIPPTHPRYHIVRFHPLYRPPRVSPPTPQRPAKQRAPQQEQEQGQEQTPSSRLPKSR